MDKGQLVGLFTIFKATDDLLGRYQNYSNVLKLSEYFIQMESSLWHLGAKISGWFKNSTSSNSTNSNSTSSNSEPDSERRIVTVLNDKQLQILRTAYSQNPRPDALVKEQLVQRTGLDARLIRVWLVWRQESIE